MHFSIQCNSSRTLRRCIGLGTCIGYVNALSHLIVTTFCNLFYNKFIVAHGSSNAFA